jgi:hypothetical protein
MRTGRYNVQYNERTLSMFKVFDLKVPRTYYDVVSGTFLFSCYLKRLEIAQ